MRSILHGRITPVHCIRVTCASLVLGALSSGALAQETFTLNADGPSGGGAITINWNAAAWTPAGEYPGLDDINDIATIAFREFNNADGTGDAAPTLDLGGANIQLSTLNFSESGTGNTDGNFANGSLTLSNINYTSGAREIDFEATTTINGVGGSLTVTSAGNNLDFLGAVNAATSFTYNAGTQFMRLNRDTTGSLGAVTQNAQGAIVIQNFRSDAAGVTAGNDTFTMASLTATNIGKIELDRVAGTAVFRLNVDGATNVNSARLRFDANDDDANINLNGLVTLANGGSGVEIGVEGERAVVNVNAGITGNELLTIASAPSTGGINDVHTININNVASTRTAQTNVNGGKVNLNVDAGLGTGQINVGANGLLNIVAGQTSLDVDVAEFGAISGNFAGATIGTNLTIAASNVVFVDDLPANAIPTIAVTGGAVHYRGLTSNAANVTIGDDGNAGTTDDIYKGVAFGSYTGGGTGNFTGTVTMAQPAQDLEVFMQTGKTFSGATLGTTGEVNIIGPGSVWLDRPTTGRALTTLAAGGADVFNRIGDVATQNSTLFKLIDSNSLDAGQTVNLTNGRFDLDSATGAAIGATVNIGQGATLVLDQSVSTGAFNILAGAGISITSAAQFTSGAEFSVAEGALFVFDGDIVMTSAFPTNVDYILHDADADNITGTGIVLGQGRRLATPSTQSVDLLSSSAPITAAPGATRVILSAASGDTLDINSTISVPGATLQINDQTGFTTIVSGGTGGTNFARAVAETQSGTVGINLTTAQSIDVQRGLLRFEQGAIAGLKAGDITTDATTIRNGGAIEIEYNQETDPAGIQINEAFFVDADHVATGSGNRTFVIDRNQTVTGGTDRIDINNVVLGDGAAIGVDVQEVTAANARFSVGLAGTATAARQFVGVGNLDDFSFNNITGVNADGSANTTAPRVLNLGFAGATTIGTTNLYGTIASNVTINQNRSNLAFNAGSSLNGATVTNNSTAANVFQSTVLNNDPGNGTINVLGNGTVEVRNGIGGGVANNLSGLTINASGTGGAVIGYVTELASGTPLSNVISANVNFTGASNTLAAERANDAAVAGSVTFANVNLRGDLALQGRNGTQLQIGSLNLTGSASLTNNNSTDIATITGGTHALTVAGGARTEVAGNLTAGNLVISGSPTAGLQFNPGTGNTSSVQASSVQVTSLLAARTGTTDLGSTVIAGVPVGTNVGGLREGRITGTADINVTTANPNNFGIQMGPRLAQHNIGTTPASPWGTSETWVYTGQIFDADGVFSFIEHVDDDVQIKVNGVEVLRNNATVGGASSASTVTASGSPNGFNGAAVSGANQGAGAGTIDFGADADGWYDIEIRIQNGTGAAGPTLSQGFNAFYGFGFSPDGATSTNPNDYIRLSDNGAMSLLRTDTVAKGAIAVDGGATLNAGGFTGIGKVTVAGTGSGTLNVTGGGQSDSGSIEVTGSATGVLNLANAGATVRTGALNVAAGATFNLTGAGQLYVNDLSTGAGAVNVNGGVLGGDGILTGPVTLNAAGKIAPGDGVGTLTASDLTLNGGTLTLEIAGPNAGVDYDQISVTGAVSLAADTPFTLTFSSFVPAPGQQFVILSNDSLNPIQGLGKLVFGTTILNENDTFTSGGMEFRVSYIGGAGANDIVLTTMVPEPSSAVSLLLGVGALLGGRRFRRR